MEMLKVLVVDDEARMRKLVKDFLTIKGYQVLEAGDGDQALEMFFAVGRSGNIRRFRLSC